MTARIHVTLRALAVLRGDSNPFAHKQDTSMCGVAFVGDEPRCGAVDADLARRGWCGWHMPPCPTCAVAWDEALESRGEVRR